MRKLAILTFITLDGVMQAPKMPEEDMSGGFNSAGWADPYWDEVMDLVATEAMDVPYDVLFGRNSNLTAFSLSSITLSHIACELEI